MEQRWHNINCVSVHGFEVQYYYTFTITNMPKILHHCSYATSNLSLLLSTPIHHFLPSQFNNSRSKNKANFIVAKESRRKNYFCELIIYNSTECFWEESSIEKASQKQIEHQFRTQSTAGRGVLALHASEPVFIISIPVFSWVRLRSNSWALDVT